MTSKDSEDNVEEINFFFFFLLFVIKEISSDFFYTDCYLTVKILGDIKNYF